MPSILAEMEKHRRRSLPPDAPLTEEEWNEARARGETLIVRCDGEDREIEKLAFWLFASEEFPRTWHRLPKAEQPKRVVHIVSDSVNDDGGVPTLCGTTIERLAEHERWRPLGAIGENTCPACARIAEGKDQRRSGDGGTQVSPPEREDAHERGLHRQSGTGGTTHKRQSAGPCDQSDVESSEPEPEPWCVVSKEVPKVDPYTLQRESLFCEGEHMGIHVETRPVCKCGLPQSLTGKVLDIASGMMVNRRCCYCSEEI